MIELVLAAQLALGSIRVLDGDTIHDNERTFDYRLAGVDTPEKGGRAACDRERELADLATAFVTETLASAKDVRAIPPHDPRGRKRWPMDGFGRRLARIEADGLDLSAELLARGLASPWGVTIDWCAAR
jgi:endonuclease YncB( thermonuclease family)